MPIKPNRDINRHVEYRKSVNRGIREYYDRSSIPQRYRDIRDLFVDLDLTAADEILRPCYSKYGPEPRRPSDMIRSLMLASEWGTTSITEWVDQMKLIPFLALVSGFDPGDVPGVGTFYGFFDRLWLLDEDNFSSHERPKRVKPKRPKRKGEKAAPVEKKPVKNLLEDFRDDPPALLEACELWWKIFESIFLARSEALGLINRRNLLLAGDGSPLMTTKLERSKRLCDCRERGITDCTCNRFFRQPDCDWGYDSHRNCYFFGYHMYLLTDPSSGHDMPIFPFLSPASRHDSHSLVYAWFAAKHLMPGFRAYRALLDAAHDALCFYDFFLDEGVEAFIDLNKGHSTTLQKKGYTIDGNGIPICAAGHPMKPAGFDKAQHRLKYRCPKMCCRNGEIICQCENPCSTAKYGRQVHVYPKSNPRLFCRTPRGSEAWKTAYNARTGSERANKRIKEDYHFEKCHHRSSKMWYGRLFIIMMCIHLDAWRKDDKEVA